MTKERQFVRILSGIASGEYSLTVGGRDYGRMANRHMVELARSILQHGAVEFRFRCGSTGKGGGYMHRVRITRRGRVSFPDHTESSDILTALQGGATAVTCDKIRQWLADGNWYKYSNPPVWARLLAFVSKGCRYDRQVTRKQARCCRTLYECNHAYRAYYAARVRAMDPSIRQVYWDSGDETSVDTIDRSITLPWSTAIEAIEYGAVLVKHESHTDIVPKVTALLPDGRLLAVRHCFDRSRKHVPGTRVMATLLKRVGGHWEVSE